MANGKFTEFGCKTESVRQRFSGKERGYEPLARRPKKEGDRS